MKEYRLANPIPAARHVLPGEAAEDVVRGWPFVAGSSGGYGGPINQVRQTHIRVLLSLQWLFVIGMWLSFPVFDLKESNSRFGSAILVGSNKYV